MQPQQEIDASPEQLRRGQKVILNIASLVPTGAGISKELGRPVFVERVAPGDQVEVELFDVRKDFAKGKVVRIIEPSTQRAEPPCPLFKVCGGCQWQHLGYQWQLEAKTDMCRQAIQHIGGLDPALVKPAIGAENVLRYRNKVQFPVKNPNNSERLLAGYFQQGSHDLVNIKFCPIQPEPLDRMLNAVKEICESHHINAYDEKTRKGLLRHINARFGFAHNEVLVTLVLNYEEKQEKSFAEAQIGERMRNIARDIMETVPEIVGVCVNLNKQAGNRILGEKTYCIAGRDYVQETLRSARADLPEPLSGRGLSFHLSSTSFFQVNTEQAVRLLEVIFDSVTPTLSPQKKPVIVDAFAGVGTMAMWLAPIAQEVIAIEEHATAVEDGQQNVIRNEMNNVRFVEGEVESVLPRLVGEGLKPDVVVLDPPRKGLSAQALEAVRHCGAPLLIYVSCNPATLARDLKILAQPGTVGPNGETIGYKTRQVQPVDLFPQTYHVESVTVLEREIGNGPGNLEEGA